MALSLTDDVMERLWERGKPGDLPLTSPEVEVRLDLVIWAFCSTTRMEASIIVRNGWCRSWSLRIAAQGNHISTTGLGKSLLLLLT